MAGGHSHESGKTTGMGLPEGKVEVLEDSWKDFWIISELDGNREIK
jgi:hypothetical protein